MLKGLGDIGLEKTDIGETARVPACEMRMKEIDQEDFGKGVGEFGQRNIVEPAAAQDEGLASGGALLDGLEQKGARAQAVGKPSGVKLAPTTANAEHFAEASQFLKVDRAPGPEAFEPFSKHEERDSMLDGGG